MAAKGGNGTNGQPLRIVMLGKTGAGKSSLGNGLLGRKPPKSDPKAKRDEKPPTHTDAGQGFKIGRGLKSETVYCDWAKSERHGTMLEVTDTPGLCDTHLDEEEIYREVAKSVAVAVPGPNVVIFALRCDRRFSPEEQMAYTKIKQLFSEDINDYLILVFNGLDNYEEDADTIADQRKCLAEDIDNFGGLLQDMVKQAQGRYIGMNNKASEAEREQQVQDLIDMMNAMVRENGQTKFYKTEMMEKIMDKVEKMAEEEAKARGVDKEEATRQLKENIVQEKVQVGFFESLAGIVSSTATAVVDGVSDMCSVM